MLWFLLLTSATEFFSSWLKRRRVVMVLDSAMGAVLIAFGLKLALDKAR
jgi:threonine/homoserine/homoserine lactone efflux protein